MRSFEFSLFLLNQLTELFLKLSVKWHDYSEQIAIINLVSIPSMKKY